MCVWIKAGNFAGFGTQSKPAKCIIKSGCVCDSYLRGSVVENQLVVFDVNHNRTLAVDLLGKNIL